MSRKLTVLPTRATLNWNPNTMFSSFPCEKISVNVIVSRTTIAIKLVIQVTLNQDTAYVFCATASDSPPIPKTNLANGNNAGNIDR